VNRLQPVVRQVGVVAGDGDDDVEVDHLSDRGDGGGVRVASADAEIDHRVKELPIFERLDERRGLTATGDR
jgi:hypothetical protein